MTFPRKWNRRIVVGEETYLWYLKRNETWMDSKHIAIRHLQSPQGQLMLLDFYAFDFELRPRSVREAIEFALANGWMPKGKAKPLYIGFDNVRFVLLPPGEQYTRVFQHPPSVTWLPQPSAG